MGCKQLKYQFFSFLEVIHSKKRVFAEKKRINYYPFGLKQKGYNNTVTSTNLAQNWKFSGKEYNQELGLNWYDVTARNYDPAIGRWMNLDPLAELMRRHSPYNYAFDNPVYFIDPDGMAPLGLSGPNTTTYFSNVTDDFLRSSGVMTPENIIIRGQNNNEITIPTAGDDITVDIPFDIKESGTLDLGLSEVNSDNIAVGYEVNASAEAKATFGAKVSAGLTVVNYLNEDYGHYNYVYANAEVTGSTGVQLGTNANIEANFFVMTNSNAISDGTGDPASFAGRTSSFGLGVVIKALAGGGVNVFGFQSGDWKGVGVGLNLGIGDGVNLGAAFRGESTSIMLSNLKITRERTFVDRTINATNGKPMIIQAVYQYLTK